MKRLKSFFHVLGEATCSVIANLFYQSFDGARLPDNSGVCLLVLAKTVNINPTSSRWFSINAAYEHRDGNTRLMYPRSIIINFRRNQSVVLWKNESIFVSVFQDVCRFRFKKMSGLCLRASPEKETTEKKKSLEY